MKYSELVNVYEQLEATTKRLEKTHIISKLLAKTSLDDLEDITLLIQGKIFANWDASDAGIASRLVLKAISVGSGKSREDVEKSWKNTGDLGKTAEQLFSSKTQATLFSQTLDTKKVIGNLRKLATMEGQGSVERKIQLVAELLTSATALEAKFIVKTVLTELRVGVGEGSLRDAITWAFFPKEIGVSYDAAENDVSIEDREVYNKYIDAVQGAYDLTNDFGTVAVCARKKGLKGLHSVEITVGNPIKVMLAIKADDAAEGVERVGTPCQAEFKYDGFRVQIHKKENGEVLLFTRRLENVTMQFPEVVACVKEQIKAKSVILDSECVGYDPKTKKYLAFQHISQRIKRKYDIEEMSKKFPVEVNVFDLMYYNGKNYLKEPFSARKEIIDKILNEKRKGIVHAKHIESSSVKEIERFFSKALKEGNEGLMLKTLDAPYKPGARVGYMVKLKSVMDTLDLVIVGAEWGEGKRAAWLSSYVIACRDENGEYLTVGRVSTGLKEKDEEGLSFGQMTEKLKPLIVKEEGKEVTVSPAIVLEVDYEEIQKSPTYASGFALRFPRVKGIREDRKPSECSTLDLVTQYFSSQKK